MALACLALATALLAALICRGMSEGARWPGSSDAGGASVATTASEAAGGDSGDVPGTTGCEAPDEMPSTSAGILLEGGALPDEFADAPVSREVREVSSGIQDAVREVLESYRGREGAVLVRAGWLDLLGGAWGCVVSGPGWVEVCLVGESGQSSSSVEVLHMEAEEWERAYGAG